MILIHAIKARILSVTDSGGVVGNCCDFVNSSIVMR